MSVADGQRHAIAFVVSNDANNIVDELKTPVGTNAIEYVWQ